MAGKREIKTTLKLDGEQQFKKAMSDAASAIKELNSEEKLAEAQFEATGDAEKYAAEQTRILKSKIEEQKKAVSEAEKAIQKMKDGGVDPNSKAMQTWRTKLNNARTALTRMQTKLNDTEDELGEQATALNNTTDDAEDYRKEMEKIGSAVDFTATISAIDNVRDRLGTIISRAAQAAKAMWDLEVGAGNWADEIQTAADVAELDVETYQAWRYASRFVDTSVESITSSYNKLNKALDEPTEDMLLSLNELSVAHLNAGGSARDSMEVYWDVIDALGEVDDKSRRDQLAMELLGRSYNELNPLIKAGSKAFLGYAEEGRAVAVVSEENMKALTDLDDATEKLEAELEKTKNTLLAELAAPFQTVAESMSAALEAFNEFIKTEEGQAALEGLKDAIGGISEKVSSVDWKTAMNDASTIINRVTSGLKWVANNSGIVIGAFAGLSAVWAGLTVSKDVLSVLQLLNTIKWAKISKVAASGAASGAAGTGGNTLGTGFAKNAGKNVMGTMQEAAKIMAGVGGMAAIVAGFAAAAHERLTNPEIRGSVGALEAQMADNEELKIAFLKYAKAQSDLESFMSSGTYDDKTAEALVDQVNSAEMEFHALEGWENVMSAYSDWRQENALGNMDWAVPEELGTYGDELSGVAEQLATTKQQMDGLDKSAANYADSVQGAAAETGKMAEAAEELNRTAAQTVHKNGSTFGGDLYGAGIVDIAKGQNPYGTAAKLTLQSPLMRRIRGMLKQGAAGLDNIINFPTKAYEKKISGIAEGVRAAVDGTDDQKLQNIGIETERIQKALTDMHGGDMAQITEGLTALQDLDLNGVLTEDTLQRWQQFINPETNTFDPGEVQQIYEDVLRDMSAYVTQAETAGSDAVSEMATAMGDNADLPVAEAESIADDTGAKLNSVDGYGAGYATGLGFAKGIDDTYELAVGAAEAMGDAVAARLRWVLQVRSPSKVMHKIGAFASLGFAKGIEDNVSAVERATTRMAQATTGRAVRGSSGVALAASGGEMIHVTLMVDGRELGDVVTPYVDGKISAQISRRR